MLIGTPWRAGMSTDPKVHVVLIHYRAPEWCSAAVRSALDSSGVDVSVAVIDNSGDLPPQPSRVAVTRSGGNSGYAGGADHGIREWMRSDTGFCLVAAHDLTLERTTLRRLVDCASGHVDFAIIAPWFDPPVARVGELATDGELVEYEWVSGSAMLLRRSAVESFGSFDTDFGSYTEDVEICMRARGHGWRVGALRTAGASSRGSASPDSAAVMMRGNQALLHVKYGHGAAAARTIGSEMMQAVAQAVGVLSRRRSSRRALRQAWVHSRAAWFGMAQVARWVIRGARRGDPLDRWRRFDP